MHDQPKLEPLETSSFFDDAQASRPVVSGTVARGQGMQDSPLSTGRSNGELVDELPVALTAGLLNRGRERFDIFCANCHGRTGNGAGMIVQRGFRRPPSLHIDRLRGAPLGHYFGVISQGFGAMPSYGHQIPVRDRWAIVAYVRALQWSQHARLDDLSPEEREELESRVVP